MSSVTQADPTIVFIRKKVRRLTASASESALSTADVDKAINVFYVNDFPYGIKIDQMRSVYTFYTIPYIDRYPLDVNYCQGVRAPVYFEGIPGALFKDRQQFYNLWPRFPTRFQQTGTLTTLTGVITGIAQPTNPTVITSVLHGLNNNAIIQISDIVGMTQLNGNSYTITVIDANTFSLNDVDNSTFGVYVSGGTWTSTSEDFSFIIGAPFLSKEVVMGGVDEFGNPISLRDDGYGNIQYMTVNPVVSVPPQNTNPALPGMYNLNTQNPGLISSIDIGTVNYVTGEFEFSLPPGVALADGTVLTIWVSQYQPGRSYNLMFWNNEFTVRPVPEVIQKVEVEVFLTPVQFMTSTDSPILNQWSQYIAYGAAMEILRERQDMDGVANLMEGFKRQEDLVLERQGTEELFVPNYTIFNSTTGNYINGGFSQGGFN
jgi:hypothetical protein